MSNYFNKEIQDWLWQRKGRITSSEYWKLTKGGRRDMTNEELEIEKKSGGKRKTIDTLFGEGAITYIRSKVTELQSSEIKEEVDFKQTEWGKNNENDAVIEFEKVTGLKIDYYGILTPVFIRYGDYAGGSPDFKVKNQRIIGEIKCPYDENKHTQRLLIKTLDEFKQIETEAWHQCQMNMVVTDTDYCYYASYDPRKVDERLRIKIIKIPKCEDWRNDFEIRYNAAVEMMADMLYDTDKYLII